MRVIAGSARGRPLVAPTGATTRPTLDRVREAVFNALASLDVLEGATVLDLFAGSGALGIEALSRGAAAATFCDVDPAARRAVQANLTATGLGDRAVVLGTDALLHAAAAEAVDLAFCDPPHRFDRWEELFGVLRAGLVVVESDRAVEPPEPWEVVRSKRYGGTVVSFVRQR
ncbi:MAG: 16S rRNA (guanine(966)-N(2))-methyltransferase RsmD [Actinobacteria bacterium]|nr:16S rRNA (guanine(966)-N(2))-methyltransferase RsmD [Actinomycetota bacterium]